MQTGRMKRCNVAIPLTKSVVGMRNIQRFDVDKTERMDIREVVNRNHTRLVTDVSHPLDHNSFRIRE